MVGLGGRGGKVGVREWGLEVKVGRWLSGDMTRGHNVAYRISIFNSFSSYYRKNLLELT